MNFNIDPKIFETYPDLKIGAIIIKGIDNTRRNSNVEGLLRGAAAQRGKQFSKYDFNEEPKVKAWKETYGKFGINPNKYPPSIAALLKRVGQGKEIPHINTLVDLYNYFSLKFMLPIGGEDLDWLCGDLNLTYTEEGDAFRPIGSINVEEAKEGEVAYKDNGGITCRYWNHKECERTKFTEKTINAVILVEDMSKMHMDEFGKMLREMQNAIIKYIGGQIEPYILTEDRTSVDLGVEGRMTANDSKVPQQEKAHFLQEEAKKKLVNKPTDQTVKKTPKKESKSLDLESEDFAKIQVKKALEEALTAAFKIEENIKVEYPNDEDHGDYASSVALQITKQLKKAPQEIAKEIIENLKTGDFIEKAEVAGPGFINVYLSKKYLEEESKKALKDDYGRSKIGDNKNIIVEYSAPNIAKPLGVHHLLSTIIGQSIYNLYKELGFNAISVNHIGDWGTQFGKLIFAYKKWGKKEDVEKAPIDELLKLYVRFHDEAEKDEKLEDEGRKEFRKFEEGDEENRELWKWFVDESMKAINKTYDKIGGIHFDKTQGESFYEDKMAPVLEEGKEKGIFVEGDEGSFIVEYEDENMTPFVVQKKDGATLYSTRDLATIKYRVDTWSPEKILYVVDVAQSLHFKQLYEAASRFDWYDDQATHVVFGRMHMKDGKMSTRKGNVILLEDVLDEAVKRAGEIIEDKNPDLKNKDEVARIVGIGSVKYNILSQNRITDITFDWDTMLSLDGNSAPYLQYTYARAKSILRKAKAATEESPSDQKPEDTAKIEEKTKSLLRALPKYKEYIARAAEEYKPNVLTNYLFDLAQKFNSFYNTVPVLKAKIEDQEARLELTEATSKILKNGLALLGVEVVEEM
ncbi:arginine--tRNA ligase [Candidatus Peregrinibacteria bacterium]|nr:arginine--tRNA ligase [Candidatus Peregrinibacteria bacterium]